MDKKMFIAVIAIISIVFTGSAVAYQNFVEVNDSNVVINNSNVTLGENNTLIYPSDNISDDYSSKTLDSKSISTLEGEATISESVNVYYEQVETKVAKFFKSDGEIVDTVIVSVKFRYDHTVNVPIYTTNFTVVSNSETPLDMCYQFSDLTSFPLTNGRDVTVDFEIFGNNVNVDYSIVYNGEYNVTMVKL